MRRLGGLTPTAEAAFADVVAVFESLAQFGVVLQAALEASDPDQIREGFALFQASLPDFESTSAALEAVVQDDGSEAMGLRRGRRAHRGGGSASPGRAEVSQVRTG